MDAMGGRTTLDFRKALADPRDTILIDYDNQQAHYGPIRVCGRKYPKANALTLADYPPSAEWIIRHDQ